MILLGDGPGQRLPCILRENLSILGIGRLIGNSLEDRSEVSNGNAFLEQVPENPADRSEGQQRRNELFHQLRIRFSDFVQQRLNFLPSQQFMAMALDQLRKMCRDRRTRINHGIPGHLSLLSGILRPRVPATESRLLRRDPLHQASLAGPRIDRQQMPGKTRLGRFNALQNDGVIVRAQLKIVSYVNGRHDKTHRFRKLPPERFNPVKQCGALRSFDESYQPVPTCTSMRSSGVTRVEPSSVFGAVGAGAGAA